MSNYCIIVIISRAIIEFIRRNGNLSSTLEHNLLHIKIRCTIRNCILKCNFMFTSWPSFTYLHCMHQYDNIYIYWIELGLVYISPTSYFRKHPKNSYNYNWNNHTDIKQVYYIRIIINAMLHLECKIQSMTTMKMYWNILPWLMS